ncbi:MAG: hypothetical protein VB142_01170 [Burkholderia sp.]
MHSKLFETALGISDPWFVNGIDFDAAAKRLRSYQFRCRQSLPASRDAPATIPCTTPLSSATGT